MFIYANANLISWERVLHHVSMVVSMAAPMDQIAEDKATYFRGTARVRVEHLIFPNPTRQKDYKIINELKWSLEGGCEDEKHPIPAIIDDNILQWALAESGLNADSLRRVQVNGPPRLQFPRDVRLECEDGQHRVLAAKQILLPEDRWWSVDLYGKG